MKLETVINFVQHILMPDTCLHCAVDLPFNYNRPLCRICETMLEEMPKLQCVRCGVMLPSGGAHCYNCLGYKSKQYKCSCIRSALVFNPPIRSVIHHFKYKQKTKLYLYLGDFLVEAFKKYEELKDCECIIPVPLSGKKLNQRGFNQSNLLGKYLADKTGLNFYDDVLVRTKYTRSQTDLSKAQRKENVKDAFSVLKPNNVKGKKILLIDDVATTTATLEVCAVSLKHSKAKVVKALTATRE